MSTYSDSSNLIDAAPRRWQHYLYALLALLLLIGLGAAVYVYQLKGRQDRETAARTALVSATTPEQKLEIAKTYAGTDQAVLAMLAAAQDLFAKKDYVRAEQTYANILANNPPGLLQTSAELGRAAALEAQGKSADAQAAYLKIADQGEKNPYAPYATLSAARLYLEQQKISEARQEITAFQRIGADSDFADQVQMLAGKLPPQTKTINPPVK